MEGTSYGEHVPIEIEDLDRLIASSIVKKLPDKSPLLLENCIFKVPGTLRRRNENIYDPNLVSIGPFHNGNDKLVPMEKIKLWYLHCLLDRLPLSPEETLQHFIVSIRGIAKEATRYYAGKIDVSEDKFVEMMVVDGCFLLELFRRDAWLVPGQENDPIFNTFWMPENLYHDLVLLENQIPWLVLQCLFDLTMSVHEQETNFLVELTLNFFETMMLMTVPAEYKSGGREIRHILDLLRTSLLSSFGDTEPTNTDWELFPPVTDLLQVGIKFKKGTPDDILNIKFSNGVFEIPPIKIRGNSEALFQNLIAYEQCDIYCTDRFTSYAVFLDCLINASTDANLLCDERIIVNALSTKDVSLLFNRLYNDTLVYDCSYGEISQEVNEYYRSQYWPRWRVTLCRDYFNNPWSISSFIAAVLILIFTFTQTLFSILSY